MTAASRDAPRVATASAIVTLVGTLCAAYAISQLLRNSIGVIAPDLAREIGLSASQIGVLSSAFFLAFAAVQLPLGVALDRYGPKRCMLVCAGITIVGTLWFASAAAPAGLIGSRVLMGLGTSCYLMAPLALYARRFPPERFATLAGLQLGIGTLGTLLATAPLALSSAMIGWRGTFVGIAGIMALAALLIALAIREDQPAEATAPRETLGQSFSGIPEVFRTDSVGRLFLMNLSTYSSFVLVIGLWGGPYLSHIYGYGLTERGNLLLIPAVTQILGLIAWGPLDRMFGNYKAPVLIGAGITSALLALLAALGTLPPVALAIWLAVFGFCAGYTPAVLAHGKSLFAPHLVGRGITLLNMGTMGGAFLSQAISGVAIDLFPSEAGAYPLAAYRLVFALQAAFVLVSCLAYLKARDPLRASNR